MSRHRRQLHRRHRAARARKAAQVRANILRLAKMVRAILTGLATDDFGQLARLGTKLMLEQLPRLLRGKRSRRAFKRRKARLRRIERARLERLGDVTMSSCGMMAEAWGR